MLPVLVAIMQNLVGGVSSRNADGGCNRWGLPLNQMETGIVSSNVRLDNPVTKTSAAVFYFCDVSKRRIS
jgi:hypothetical protein